MLKFTFHFSETLCFQYDFQNYSLAYFHSFKNSGKVKNYSATYICIHVNSVSYPAVLWWLFWLRDALFVYYGQPIEANVSFHTWFKEARVRYHGFGKEEDEWVNVKDGVRERSIPLEASECHKLKEGHLVLCFLVMHSKLLFVLHKHNGCLVVTWLMPYLCARSNSFCTPNI